MKAETEYPAIKAELDLEFHEALKIGNLSQSEEWLEEEKQIILKDEPEWVEELEQLLFDAYVEKGDNKSAKRVAENSMNPDSKDRRLKALTESVG
ncbi:MAG: hypothetical protein WCW66_05955 [Patescibacteria group bacterium]